MVSEENFKKLVAEALDDLPDKFKEKLHNLAILVADRPSKEQLKKLKMNNNYFLYGLFEGYVQSKRINFGAVLPDRITIFRQSICGHSSSIEEIRNRVKSTVKHEIAHHFGSDEKGARKAGRN